MTRKSIAQNMAWKVVALAFFTCTPKTLAGVAAALEYSNEAYVGDKIDEWGDDSVLGQYAGFTGSTDWPLAAEIGEAARSFLPKPAAAIRAQS